MAVPAGEAKAEAASFGPLDSLRRGVGGCVLCGHPRLAEGVRGKSRPILACSCSLCARVGGCGPGSFENDARAGAIGMGTDVAGSGFPVLFDGDPGAGSYAILTRCGYLFGARRQGGVGDRYGREWGPAEDFGVDGHLGRGLDAVSGDGEEPILGHCPEDNGSAGVVAETEVEAALFRDGGIGCRRQIGDGQAMKVVFEHWEVRQEDDVVKGGGALTDAAADGWDDPITNELTTPSVTTCLVVGTRSGVVAEDCSRGDHDPIELLRHERDVRGLRWAGVAELGGDLRQQDNGSRLLEHGVKGFRIREEGFRSIVGLCRTMDGRGGRFLELLPSTDGGGRGTHRMDRKNRSGHNHATKDNPPWSDGAQWTHLALSESLQGRMDVPADAHAPAPCRAVAG